MEVPPMQEGTGPADREEQRQHHRTLTQAGGTPLPLSPAARAHLMKPPVARSSTTPRSQAGMHTPVPHVSTYQGIINDIEMGDADEDDGWPDEEDGGGQDEDDGGGQDDDDGGSEDEFTGRDCVEGQIEPGMVDSQFLQGEEERKFKSKVWNEFTKVRIGGVVAKGKCKHCNAEITARSGVGTSAMGKHLKRCKVRQKARKFVDNLQATVMSPDGVRLKGWKFSQSVPSSLSYYFVPLNLI